MNRGGTPVTRELFEKNLDSKLRDNSFLDDIGPLLSPDLAQSHSTLIVTEGWSLTNAAEEVKNEILVHLT